MPGISEPRPAQPGGLWNGAIAAVGVLLFYTNIDSYGFAINLAPPPTVWVVGFVAIALFIACLDSSRVVRLLRSPLSYWVLFYFLLTTAWAIFISGAPELTQELSGRYRSIGFLLAMGLIFDDPRARSAAVIAIAACVAMAVALNVAETLSLVTFAELSRTPGRSAGFYMNPNSSGVAIALGVAVITERIPKILRVPLLLMGAVGVAATFSRGATVCLAIVVLWLIWRRALGTGYVVLAAVGGVFLFLYAVTYLQSHDLLSTSAVARLQLAQDDNGRIGIALKAWEMFLKEPGLGNGLGSTLLWDEGIRAHNMYFTLAADHGLLGLLTYPAFCWAIFKSNRGAAGLALVLMMSGFFSHGVLDDRCSLLLTALAANFPLEAPQPEALPLGEAVAQA
ncbi:MAG: hypothetical protein A2V77_18410 [Anaeromyxobacter sp. RBG_16_69_14]|nr:MAG: hypothetical protein A2V77_18410 [Anaeromyxobacter sp. RBG_16_69_14]